MNAPRFRTISVVEATAILISTIIGVGVLALPRFAVEDANSAGPFITMLAVILSFFGVWVLTKLGIRFPNQSIIEYGERILGTWPARFGSVLIITFSALLTAFAAREFGKVVVSAVLPRTPVEVTTIIMLLLAAICTRATITTFAYAHLFYLPFILAPGLVIVVLSTKNGRLTNLQPILGNGVSWVGMIPSFLTITALFQGFFIMSFVIPAMRQPRKAMKASVWGLGISGGLYLLIVVATVAVFGSEETKILLWPFLELAKTTLLPGEVLERLDGVFLIVWVTAVFTTLYSTYSLTAWAIRDLFRLRDHKMLSFWLLPMVFLIAMLPPDIVELYRIIKLIGRIGLIVTIVYPLLLLGVAWIRKQRDVDTHV